MSGSIRLIFQPECSNFVTNGVVISGAITAIENKEAGIIYQFGYYGGKTEIQDITSGMQRAFDAETGK